MTDGDAPHRGGAAYGPGSVVLVTGSGGFIGAHVARRLRAIGYCVLEVGGRADCDLADFGQARRRLRGRDGVPDVIVHLAASRDPRGAVELYAETIENTVGATVGLRRAIPARARCLIIHVGSYKQYGEAAGIPFRESMVPMPVTPYGIAKQRSEQHLMDRSTDRVRCVYLRMGAVFGPGQPETALVPRTIRTVLDGDWKRLVAADALWDPLYVDDAVAAIAAAMVRPRSHGRVINVSSGVRVPVRDVVRSILMQMHAAPEGFHSIDANTHPPYPSLVGDISRARRLLGWHPVVSITDGLQRVISSVDASRLQRA